MIEPIKEYPDWVNRDTVIELANCIRAVEYLDKGMIQNFSGNITFFGGKASFCDISNFGAVITKDDSLIIAMRGTKGIHEWITDGELTRSAMFWPKQVLMNDPEFGEVHHGFNEMFESCLPEILKILSPIGAIYFKNVYVTGHSLGGAVANLMSAALSCIQGIPLKLVTFACPKVGGSKFRNAFNSRVPNALRIYNEYDEVPKLPPSILPGFLTPDYMHTGEPASCSFDFGSPVNNHTMVNYLKAL